jgi:N-acetylglucosaminyl-diphospho-decaprenol L-rhamnosyltransferase
MVLTIVLVSYNTKALIDPCFAALDKARARIGASEVIVIDNASRDGSAEHLEENYPDVRLIRSPINVGFGRANNLALPFAHSPFVLLLNTDAFVSEDSLEKSLDCMRADAHCGIVGVRLVGRDGEIQPSCRYFPTPLNVFVSRTATARLFPSVRTIDGPDFAPAKMQNCDWVPGCFYLIRKEVIDRVGLFDPRFFLYYEEVDHCLATQRAGWNIVYLPTTTVIHIGGESAKSDGALTKSGKQVDRISMESAQLYFRKNFGLSAFLAHVWLDLVADVYLMLKAIVRKGDWPTARRLLVRMSTTIGLGWATRMGTHATR